MLKAIKLVEYTGKCPGGVYYDQMNKQLPCPQKTVTLPSHHPFILSHINQGNDIYNVPILCSRCRSQIILKPKASQLFTDIIFTEDLKEI